MSNQNSQEQPIPNLRKKGNGWEARMKWQGIHYSAYASNSAEAAVRIKEKILLSGSAKPTETTFKSLMEALYIPAIQHTSEKYRHDEMRTAINNMPWFNYEVSKITRAMIQAYASKSSIGGRTRTLENVIRITRAVLKLAVLDGFIPTNPADYIKLPKIIHEDSRYLEPLELRALISYAVHKKSKAIAPFTLTGLLGIGWEELRHVTPEHIKRESLKIVQMKTKYRARELPLPHKVSEILKHQKLPLVSKSDRNVFRSIELVAEPLGIVTPGRNVLRRTAATGLQELGCPLEIRAMILGHVPPGGDTKRYSLSKMLEQKSMWLNQWVDEVLPAGWENCWERILAGKEVRDAE